jgi:branched-chain amino acid transport system substrate-binding protein
MNNLDKTSGMSRRQFLVKVGLVTGAVATLPLHAHARFLWDGRPPLTVGAVIPESSLHPFLGKNLVEGLRLSFDEAGWKSTALHVEHSANSSSIASAVKLLTDRRVDVLTGMVNPLMIQRLRGELEHSGTVFINMEGGANSYTPREESPLVFHNSLGYWQANWSLGSWAASAVGTRAFVASSLYEAGYDSFYAFPQGFEQSGGRTVGREIALTSGKESLEQLFSAIRAARPDFVFASFSGREAVNFVRAYAASGLSVRIPLVASGFTVDEALLKEMGSSALGIRSALSWSPAIATAENSAFGKAYRAGSGREPDQFSLLGYDTGKLITSAVNGAKEGTIQGEALKLALKKSAIATPRGRLTIDPATGCTDAPLYLREVRRDGNSLCNAVIRELSGIAATAKLADVSAMTAMSGWTSSYLCA